MKPNEAINIIEDVTWEDNGRHYGKIVPARELAISALTKQVPMAVRGMQDFCVCQRTVYPRMNYCPGCGQKLDWGKKE